MRYFLTITSLLIAGPALAHHEAPGPHLGLSGGLVLCLLGVAGLGIAARRIRGR